MGIIYGWFLVCTISTCYLLRYAKVLLLPTALCIQYVQNTLLQCTWDECSRMWWFTEYLWMLLTTLVWYNHRAGVCRWIQLPPDPVAPMVQFVIMYYRCPTLDVAASRTLWRTIDPGLLQRMWNPCLHSASGTIRLSSARVSDVQTVFSTCTHPDELVAFWFACLRLRVMLLCIATGHTSTSELVCGTHRVLFSMDSLKAACMELQGICRREPSLRPCARVLLERTILNVQVAVDQWYREQASCWPRLQELGTMQLHDFWGTAAQLLESTVIQADAKVFLERGRWVVHSPSVINSYGIHQWEAATAPPADTYVPWVSLYHHAEDSGECVAVARRSVHVKLPCKMSTVPTRLYVQSGVQLWLHAGEYTCASELHLSYIVLGEGSSLHLCPHQEDIVVRFSTPQETDCSRSWYYTWEHRCMRAATGIFGESLPHDHTAATIDTRFRARARTISQLKEQMELVSTDSEKEALQQKVQTEEQNLKLSYQLGGKKITSVGMTFVAR